VKDPYIGKVVCVCDADPKFKGGGPIEASELRKNFFSTNVKNVRNDEKLKKIFACFLAIFRYFLALKLAVKRPKNIQKIFFNFSSKTVLFFHHFEHFLC
jgi:hypothetical protein